MATAPTKPQISAVDQFLISIGKKPLEYNSDGYPIPPEQPKQSSGVGALVGGGLSLAALYAAKKYGIPYVKSLFGPEVAEKAMTQLALEGGSVGLASGGASAAAAEGLAGGASLSGAGGIAGAAAGSPTGPLTGLTGASYWAGPAAFIASAPLWAPPLAKGGMKLGQLLGVTDNKPERQYIPSEVIRSKRIGGQLPGFDTLNDAQKQIVTDKANALGMLRLPGVADKAGNTQSGIGSDFIMPRWMDAHYINNYLDKRGKGAAWGIATRPLTDFEIPNNLGNKARAQWDDMINTINMMKGGGLAQALGQQNSPVQFIQIEAKKKPTQLKPSKDFNPKKGDFKR